MVVYVESKNKGQAFDWEFKMKNTSVFLAICIGIYIVTIHASGAEAEIGASVLNEISSSIDSPKKVEIPFRIIVKKETIKSSMEENGEERISSSKTTIECIYSTESKWAQNIEEHRIDSEGNQRDIKTIKVNDGNLYRTLDFDPDDSTTDDPPYTGVVDKGGEFLKDFEELSYFQMGKPLRQYRILSKAIKNGFAQTEDYETVENEKCLKVSTKGKSSGEGGYVYWINTEKGYHIQKIEEYDANGRIIYTYNGTGLTDFGDGVWLPEKAHRKSYVYKNETQEVSIVREESYELVTFEKNYAASPEIFTIDYPQDAEIMDMLLRRTIIVGQESESLGIPENVFEEPTLKPAKKTEVEGVDNNILNKPNANSDSTTVPMKTDEREASAEKTISVDRNYKVWILYGIILVVIAVSIFTYKLLKRQKRKI